MDWPAGAADSPTVAAALSFICCPNLIRLYPTWTRVAKWCVCRCFRNVTYCFMLMLLSFKCLQSLSMAGSLLISELCLHRCLSCSLRTFLTTNFCDTFNSECLVERSLYLCCYWRHTRVTHHLTLSFQLKWRAKMKSVEVPRDELEYTKLKIRKYMRKKF
jgi:hypothetical protein